MLIKRIAVLSAILLPAAAWAIIPSGAAAKKSPAANKPPTLHIATTTTVDPIKIKTWDDAIKANNLRVWNAAVAKFRAEQAERAREQRIATWAYAVKRAKQDAARRNSVSSYSQPHVQSSAPATSFGNLSGVVQCIKNHESGNYSEHSHPGAGSGAYQFIPSTWRSWSAAAGYPGYSYAYLAPPSVQDAVLMYTLTHGGAHNWDPAFGDDPCTTGMG